MAVDFSGSTVYLSNTSWTGPTAPPMTWAGWVNKDTTAAHFLMNLNFDSTNSFEFLIDGGDNLRFRVQDSGGQDDATIAGAANDTWHHCAGSTSATNARDVYLDGTIGTPGTGTHTPTAPTRIDIAAGDDRIASHFNGELCHFGIWDRVLSQEEITGLAQGWHPRFYSNGLVFLWDGFKTGEDDVYGLALTATGVPTKSTDHPPVFFPSPVNHGGIIAATPADPPTIAAAGLISQGFNIIQDNVAY